MFSFIGTYPGSLLLLEMVNLDSSQLDIRIEGDRKKEPPRGDEE